jgi:hypothetical protein
MRVIAGVDIDRSYSIEEMLDMYERGYLKAILAHGGLVPRANGDGTIQFAAWDQTYLGNLEKTGATRFYAQDNGNWVEDARAEVEKDHPIVRRTPQERVTAMALRLLAQARASDGVIPGLTEEEIRKIVGYAWTQGVTEITMDDMRKVAAKLMGVAEVDNREADSHRVTRLHPTA